MKSIVEEALALSLDQLLKDHYAVPQFQRPYVWRKKHVTQFFDDLFSAYSENNRRSQYFIGSIVVYNEPSSGRLQLVDGQQRMLTLILLISACRDRVLDLNEDADVGLFETLLFGPMRRRGRSTEEARVLARTHPDREILEAIIDGQGEMLDIARYPAFQRQMIHSYNHLLEFTHELFTQSDVDLKKFAQFILESVSIVRLTTDSFASALQIFETINARGENLSAFDLVKNYLFSLTGAADRSALQELWNKITEEIGETVGPTAPSQNSSSIRFLRYFIMSHFDTKTVVQAQTAFTWIRGNALRGADSKDAVRFARTMELYARAYNRLHEGKYPTKEKKHVVLVALSRLGTPVRQYLPLIMAARAHPDEVLDILIDALERLVVVYLLAGEKWNRLESSIPDWSKRVRASGTMSAMEQFVARHIDPEVKSHRTKATLQLEMLGTSGLAVQRYILGRMAQHIDKFARQAHWPEHYFEPHVTVEHVFPQHPDEDEWERFRDVGDKDEFINQLGNLTPLYSIKNKVLGNLEFDEKKKVYRKDECLLTQSLGHNIGAGKNSFLVQAQRRLHTPSVWAPSSVEKRTAKMLAIASDIWGL